MKQIEQQTGKTPGALAERPQLPKELWYYRKVFDKVGGSRNYSSDGSPLPIPISEVLAYCDMFYIRGLDERETLLNMVRQMDHAYREHIRKKQETASKSKTPLPRK